jgi:hypothetical protein
MVLRGWSCCFGTGFWVSGVTTRELLVLRAVRSLGIVASAPLGGGFVGLMMMLLLLLMLLPGGVPYRGGAID